MVEDKFSVFLGMQQLRHEAEQLAPARAKVKLYLH
jgi:hypothetical protein